MKSGIRVLMIIVMGVLACAGCSGGIGSSGADMSQYTSQSVSGSDGGSAQVSGNSDSSVGVKVKIKWPDRLLGLDSRYIPSGAQKVVVEIFHEDTSPDDLVPINSIEIVKPNSEGVIKTPLGKVSFELYADDSGTIVSDCKKRVTIEKTTTDISFDMGVTVMVDKNSKTTIRPQLFKCPVGTSFPVNNYSYYDAFISIYKDSSDENSPFSSSPLAVNNMTSYTVSSVTKDQVGEHKYTVNGVQGIIKVIGESIKTLTANPSPLSISTQYDTRTSTVSAALVKYSKESGEQPYGNKVIVFSTTRGSFKTSQGNVSTTTVTTDATTGIATVDFLSYEAGDAVITAKMQDNEDTKKDCTIQVQAGDVDVTVH